MRIATAFFRIYKVPHNLLEVVAANINSLFFQFSMVAFIVIGTPLPHEA